MRLYSFRKKQLCFQKDGYGNPEQLQLTRAVDKYLHDHAEELSKPDTYLVIVARESVPTKQG